MTESKQGAVTATSVVALARLDGFLTGRRGPAWASVCRLSNSGSVPLTFGEPVLVPVLIFSERRGNWLPLRSRGRFRFLTVFITAALRRLWDSAEPWATAIPGSCAAPQVRSPRRLALSWFSIIVPTGGETDVRAASWNRTVLPASPDRDYDDGDPGAVMCESVSATSSATEVGMRGSIWPRR